MGGAETWLVQVGRFLDPERIRLDVAVNNAMETPYTVALRERGWRVLACPSLENPISYAHGFRRLLDENGPYNVVHSHLQLFSGLVMRQAHLSGVPVRIAHARNSSDGKKLTPVRLAYRGVMRYWLARHATKLLAVSRSAALGAFGPKYGDEEHCRLLTAVDFTHFSRTIDRAGIRNKLAIPQRAKVVGHVGSFRKQKNHNFLLDVAKSVVERRADVVFLLVGDGPLRHSVEDRARNEGLAERVRFLGERDDVASLLLGAMDSFLFPSLYEGLPRVLVEAQAAGLPCTASSTIDKEAAAYPGAVSFLNLDTGPETWATEILKASDSPRDPNRGPAAIKAFTDRGFTPEANARVLTDLYEGALAS